MSLLTSAYGTFLVTLMKQDFLSDYFFVNWLSLIPKTYLLVLPFTLITGPMIRALVERMFRNEKIKN
ncbi:DUF2798 domain-containing protein [Adhaeribacter terreus]|uniref:DUF2798 domain-containing protein n=1 Tax=Adhaeribacter terreus TaxID=529703 RepID=A0ABW0EA52_9BACT